MWVFALNGNLHLTELYRPGELWMTAASVHAWVHTTSSLEYSDTL